MGGPQSCVGGVNSPLSRSCACGGGGSRVDGLGSGVGGWELMAV